MTEPLYVIHERWYFPHSLAIGSSPKVATYRQMSYHLALATIQHQAASDA